MSKPNHVAFALNIPEVTPSFTLKPNGVVESNKVVGSPINFRRQQASQVESSNSSSTSYQLRSYGAIRSTIKTDKKQRPSTAAVLGSSQMLQMLQSSITTTSNNPQEISCHENAQKKVLTKKKNEEEPDTSQRGSSIEATKNSSSGFDLDRMLAFYDTNVNVLSDHKLKNQQHQLDASQHVTKVITTRCSGCGQFAEVCLKCFAAFKEQEVSDYKKRLILSVETLFEKATARSFTKISFVIVKWMFNSWKQTFLERRQSRQQRCQQFKQHRVRKLFRDWTKFHYERRVIGAMLFAQQQQQVSSCKVKEMLSLQGDVFEQNSMHQVELKVLQQTNQNLLNELQQANQQIEAKNQELTQLRQKLKQTQNTLSILNIEKQKMDPQMIDRLQKERQILRKTTLQLMEQLLLDMETQLAEFTTIPTKPKVLFQNIFSTEILSTLEQPEHPSLYSLSSNPNDDHEILLVNNKMQNKRQMDVVNTPNRFNTPTDRADLILVQWVNHLIKQQNWISCPEVSNFDDSLQDGNSIVVLTKILYDHMSKVNTTEETTDSQRQCLPPPSVPLLSTSSTGIHTTTGSTTTATQLKKQMMLSGEPLSPFALEKFIQYMEQETNPQERVELLASTLGQALWLPQGLLNGRDVVTGDTDMNFALFAYLFCTCSNHMEDTLWKTMCQEIQRQFEDIKSLWKELQVHQNESFNISNSVDFTTRLKLLLFNTLDLKRQVKEETTRMHQSQLIWTKSVHIVLRKTFLSLIRLARGQVGVVNLKSTTTSSPGRNKKEDFTLQFASLQPSKQFINEFMNTKEEEIQEESASSWELKVIQSYLRTVYYDLARIYQAYATRHNKAINTASATTAIHGTNDTTEGHTVTSLSQKEATPIFLNVDGFMELLTECRVLDTQFTPNDVLPLIRSMKLKNVQVLPPNDFLEALVRVGRRKYTTTARSMSTTTTTSSTSTKKKPAAVSLTFSESFCVLVGNFILPHASYAEGDLFQKQMEDPRFGRFLMKNAELLRPLYAQYCIEKTHSPTTITTTSLQHHRAAAPLVRMKKRDPMMTIASCVQLLRDKKILDEVFTMDKMDRILFQVAIKKTKINHTNNNGSTSTCTADDNEEEQISFDGFQEVLAAIACHKFPDPYISLETRVEKLIHLYLYPSKE